jgi:hypothetical protein
VRRDARAIQPGLGARLGVDVADLVEHAETVVVAQDERRFRALDVGSDDLMRRFRGD